MATKKQQQSEPETMEVVAVSTIHSGPAEAPIATTPGRKVTLEKAEAEELIRLGHAAKPQDEKDGAEAEDGEPAPAEDASKKAPRS